MIIKPNFIPSPSIEPSINVGCGLDIPTGIFVPGVHGESILNGGIGYTTAIAGNPNHYKSKLLHYLTLSAASKIAYVTDTNIITYDTEVNIVKDHLRFLTQKFDQFKGIDIIASEINDGIWIIFDKREYYANQWYEIMKEYVEERMKQKKHLTFDTPFVMRDNKTLVTMMAPFFSEIDSFSRFEAEDTIKQNEENELGDSGGNNIYIRQGLVKSRFLLDLPVLTSKNFMYFLTTSWVGEKAKMQGGMPNIPPKKKMQYLPGDEILKGTPDGFLYSMINSWHIYKAATFSNQNTKGPEYPRNSEEQVPGDTDLQIISLRQLRGKAGPSGFNINIIGSQSEGVLPILSEFHYLKDDRNRFGISGNRDNWTLDIYPVVNLKRTNIREKIDSDPLLRRAINITSEIAQMHQRYKFLDEGTLCTPSELYEDIKKLGFKWEDLLQTRGWWTLNNDKQPIHFLSSMDLLNMRLKKYHPYFL